MAKTARARLRHRARSVLEASSEPLVANVDANGRRKELRQAPPPIPAKSAAIGRATSAAPTSARLSPSKTRK